MEGQTDERKDRRKEGRKDGKKEGRKDGKKEGRTDGSITISLRNFAGEGIINYM
jgi:flagellar biosynthesis/type III secretory pathway protein FliH